MSVLFATAKATAPPEPPSPVIIDIDGTLILTGTANQQVDGWVEGWGNGSDRNGTTLISAVGLSLVVLSV